MDLESLFDGSLYIIFYGRFGPHEVDGESSTGNVINGDAAEKVRKFPSVHGGGSDNKFEVVPPPHDVSQNSKKNVWLGVSFLLLYNF